MPRKSAVSQHYLNPAAAGDKTPTKTLAVTYVQEYHSKRALIGKSRSTERHIYAATSMKGK
jgi:hypothetical protein